MAEEPASPTEQTKPHPTGEDLKAAAALSHLSTTAEDLGDASPHTSSTQTAALGAAVSSMTIADGTAGKDSAKPGGEPPRKVKVAPADVEWLVRELEVSKSRATELLRAKNADREEVVREFVLGSAQA